MLSEKLTLLILVCASILILTACGTFEVGVENNPLPILPTQAEESSPVSAPTLLPEEPTAEPELSDEQAIKIALGDKLGLSMEDMPFAVSEISDQHAKGGVGNAYFLASKHEGQWVIVYDGQANPPCEEIELNNFPLSMVPECLDQNNQLVVRGENSPSTEPGLVSLECGPGSPGADFGTPESVACNIQDGLRSRNTSALLGYMADPFTLAYYRSEGVQASPAESIETLHGLYNFNDVNYAPRLTFTTDRDQFPGLDGMQPEAMFGPEVDVIQVIYSQGWGLDGQGGSLLYLIQDESGNDIWYALLYSQDNFSQ